ncbi:MAG TPA: hypothetical protein RMF84_09695 [Polyangiaceae bacterium LLY-WYZ-14_1]|nr:hypothetical protein [Polyangiaceae bacterium LLY-WYZ-14_1]
MKPAAAASPLLGYNTNVRHRGRVYHIQTEDSGLERPHVITHLFADGGRIVASQKTSYADHVASGGYPATVKQLMQDQHKAMFIALRAGTYDDSEDAVAAPPGGAGSPTGAAATRPNTPKVDVAALEKAAAQLAKGGYTVARKVTPPARPASGTGAAGPPPSRPFGADLVSEKSLDEVILGYLAEELDGDGGPSQG